MRKAWLKENQHALYSHLLTQGELKAHCLEVEKRAEEMILFLIKKMATEEGVTEALKKEDQLAWVQKMNSIKASLKAIKKSLKSKNRASVFEVLFLFKCRKDKNAN